VFGVGEDDDPAFGGLFEADGGPAVCFARRGGRFLPTFGEAGVFFVLWGGDAVGGFVGHGGFSSGGGP